MKAKMCETPRGGICALRFCLRFGARFPFPSLIIYLVRIFRATSKNEAGDARKASTCTLPLQREIWKI